MPSPLGSIFNTQFQNIVLPDAFWEWARCFNVITCGLNHQIHPHLANDPVLGTPFARQTIYGLCPQACHKLLTWLGLALQHELVSWRAESLRFLDPQVWERGEVASTIHTQIVFSSLVLPGGKLVPYLRNEITFSYQEERQPFIVDLSFL